ncbi:putative mediator of RNA polymerase II transcription subunit 12 [Bicyclus anynana]|uniref:Mediator of RNA polymerase II transcription subunit 12 n=1 Tax=Bicyclus anynana TaxID=110368 RepID=A0A6J1NDZ7_BICAN|nr:putative mediator of RNA polymerase II transcription subunit 12 [Bicyclus anynana]
MTKSPMMGRKALIAVLCCIAFNRISAKAVKSESGVGLIDNISAESVPQLYRNVPNGVYSYASATPYAAYSFHVPQFVAPNFNQIVPLNQERILAQSTNNYLKDSYGQRFVEAPQAYAAYKAALPQQFVPLQKLPAHLSQPLVAAAPSAQYGQHFFGAPFRLANLQAVSHEQTNPFGISQPLVYAQNVRTQVASPGPKPQAKGQPVVQQQSTRNNNVYADVHSARYSNFWNEPKAQVTQEEPKISASDHNENQQIVQSLPLVHEPKQTTITSFSNGKKTVVNLITKPPVPLLDLTLLEPLTFDNPLVPQVQHFLPKIHSVTYKKLPELKQNNQQKVITIKRKTTKKIKKQKKPKVSKDEIEVNHIPTVIDADEHPELSYEVKSPNYKETYTEKKVSYNKETQSKPVHVSYEKKTEMKPVTYSYGKTTQNEPVHYNYVQTSNDPAQIKQAYLEDNKEKTKHLIYHFTPEELSDENNQQSSDTNPPLESVEIYEENPNERVTEDNNQQQQHHQQQQQHEPQHQQHYGPQHHNQPQQHHPQHHPQHHHQEQHYTEHKRSHDPEQHQHQHQQYQQNLKPQNHQYQQHQKHEAVPHKREHHNHQSQHQYEQHKRNEHHEPQQHQYQQHKQNEHHEPQQHQYQQHKQNEYHEPQQHQYQQHKQNEHHEPQHHQYRQHEKHEPQQNQYQQHKQHEPKQINDNAKHELAEEAYNQSKENFRDEPDPEDREAAYYENPKQNNQHEHRQEAYYETPKNAHVEAREESPELIEHKSPEQDEKQYEAIVPEYEEDITIVPNHPPHAPERSSNIKHKSHPETHSEEVHYDYPKSYYSSQAEPEEKSNRIIVKDDPPQPRQEEYKPNDELIEAMVKKQEENEDDFEQAYKDAAYGFPAYDTPVRNVDTEKEIYNPANYGVPRFHNDFGQDKSQLREYEPAGDDYPSQMRSNYEDTRDKMNADYYTDYAGSGPQSLVDRKKKKEQYYDNYNEHKPQKYYSKEDSDKQQSAKYSVPAYSYPGAPEQKKFAKFTSRITPLDEYNYAKEKPVDSSAFGTGTYSSKTQFLAPHYQYGFEPIRVSRLLDRELAAMASDDSPETVKKMYKENFYIEKSSTSKGGKLAS